MFKLFLIFLLAVYVRSELPPPPTPQPEQCESLQIPERFDCHPEDNSSQEKCEARGCCWRVEGKLPSPGVPFCYYPRYVLDSGYDYVNTSSYPDGQTGFLNRTYRSPYPRDVPLLKIDVEYQTNHRVRVKISDAENERYEAPYPKISKKANEILDDPQYVVDLSFWEQGFIVTRQDKSVM